MKVLWLASWFPNRTDPSTGDFIERHANAVASFVNQLYIIIVIKDVGMPAGTVEIIKTKAGNQTRYMVYYGKSRWGGLIDKFVSFRKYIFLQEKIYKQMVTEIGEPDLVHVQVAMKAGLFAKQLKKKYDLPYIVTEHWSGYKKECRPNLYDMGKYFTSLNNAVLKHATLLLPVSDDLGKIITNDFVKINYQVVPNVVDTTLFYYQPRPINIFRFIHPSYMNYQKNPEGILQACRLLKEKGYVFEVTMVGNRESWLVEMAAAMNLLDKYVFIEEAVAYSEVAKMMQGSSALLLFSRYENLPCVMLEALCCGLPVISSRVGGIPEVINESNGLLVENENIIQLAEAMEQLMIQYARYDKGKIAEAAIQRYNYNTIGKQYADVYQKFQKNKTC